MRPELTPDDFLPLKRNSLHVLIAVAAGQRHGYAIRKDVERRSEGHIRLWPTTLYRAIAELIDVGLLDEDPHDDPTEDGRSRRLYRITPLGQQVLVAEVARLEEVVQSARSIGGFLEGEGRTA